MLDLSAFMAMPMLMGRGRGCGRWRDPVTRRKIRGQKYPHAFLGDNEPSMRRHKRAHAVEALLAAA